MSQFDDNCDEYVRNIASEVIETFSTVHFQALWPAFCMANRVSGTSVKLKELIKRISSKHPDVAGAADLFATAMLQMAVSTSEEILNHLNYMYDLIPDGNSESIRQVWLEVEKLTKKNQFIIDDMDFLSRLNLEGVRNIMERIDTITSKDELRSKVVILKSKIDRHIKETLVMYMAPIDVPQGTLGMPGFYRLDSS
jgi:hypothetical protein